MAVHLQVESHTDYNEHRHSRGKRQWPDRSGLRYRHGRRSRAWTAKHRTPSVWDEHSAGCGTRGRDSHDGAALTRRHSKETQSVVLSLKTAKPRVSGALLV